MEFSLYEIISGFVVTLYLIRCWLTKTFDYWRKRHVAGPKPIPLFGTFKNVALNKINIVDYVKSVYDAYPDQPAVGLFFRSEPVLLVKDPKIIEDVLIKSFLTFRNRGLRVHEDIEPLEQHLVFLDYKRWKPLRRKLNPLFTSEKLKSMFYLMNECTKYFVSNLERIVTKGEPIECRKLTEKFTNDVIGVCAFGLSINAISDDNSEFRILGRELHADSWTSKLKLLNRTLPHWLAVMLKPIVRNDKMINFFVDTVKDTMDYRKTNNIRRGDFIDILIDMKDQSEPLDHANMSDIFLTAQAFAFFVAGFETSSTTMSHVMYELALNPDVQDKLRAEVNIAYDKDNGKLRYETVQNMSYLDQVFLETLRKYPPVFGLIREANDDHVFVESRISISKGTKIFIPTYAIHRDPDIYPEPEKFDPERFTDEAVKLRSRMTFLPFGNGPRNCIGERFVSNQIKLGLAAAIRQFKFEICDKTCKVYKKRLRSLILMPEENLYLKIVKL